MTDYRLAVLGLGGIGSAAAYWASRRLGADVLGVEQFELGHPAEVPRITAGSSGVLSHPCLCRAGQGCLRGVGGGGGRLRGPTRSQDGGLDLAPADASIGLDDYRAAMSCLGRLRGASMLPR